MRSKRSVLFFAVVALLSTRSDARAAAFGFAEVTASLTLDGIKKNGSSVSSLSTSDLGLGGKIVVEFVTSAPPSTIFQQGSGSASLQEVLIPLDGVIATPDTIFEGDMYSVWIAGDATATHPGDTGIADRKAVFQLRWWNATEDVFEFQVSYSLAAMGLSGVDFGATEDSSYRAQSVVAYLRRQGLDLGDNTQTIDSGVLQARSGYFGNHFPDSATSGEPSLVVMPGTSGYLLVDGNVRAEALVRPVPEPSAAGLFAAGCFSALAVSSGLKKTTRKRSTQVLR